MRTCEEVWPSSARCEIVDFVLVDAIEVEERRAGIVEDAIDSRIDGVGWRVGRTMRGLPNVGRDNVIGAGVG